MANTLTNLVPDLYDALDTVSRELTGLIPSVTRDSDVERAALNQTVRSIVAPAATASDITPAVTPPDDGDQTIGNVDLTITKSRRAPFRWDGEQSLSIDNGGPGVDTIRTAQMIQAMRTLVNEVEADLGALYTKASRAYGTAGTTPFASDLAASAEMRKILSNNGAPLEDLQLVANIDAGTTLRTLTQLTAANQAATDATLRRGELLALHGFAVRESAQIKSHTKGTGSGYLVNNASGYSVGDTTIAADTGTGTILAGDVVTFAGDSNKYLVTTALSGGSFTIAEPGLRAALANNAAITVGANYAANMAFARSAIVLATRPPALPDNGDLASDRTIIADPNSGLAFEVAMYPQYRQIQYEVSLAWGVKVIKPEHVGILLG